MSDQIDCLVIGGGPAGLTAAIYLARFHLDVIVADGGNSRALQIPCTHNHAGFPDGISGLDLLTRMRSQAIKYGARIFDRCVHEIDHSTVFSARGRDFTINARAVLIATGVTNRRPPTDEALHSEALRLGRLRYCPVCDGYEVTGQDVAVIGSDADLRRCCGDGRGVHQGGPPPTHEHCWTVRGRGCRYWPRSDQSCHG
jgi:thioredoxin reductase (NADPH)